ncbi:hypothetical protein Acr_00g0042470 [Actinidia rufa]|uniref:Uncharacterized protein n=1 Tax=Actinidia rufa TaxID=165716 RepID=A0A7J0DII9_9ERIC|nr:hypothetical protein Acr_00g0042470 [Actinidia rufa]
MVPKPRNLGKKKAARAKLVQPTPNPILAIPSPVMEVQSNVLSSKVVSKRKGKQPIEAVVELGKQVTNDDTSRDYETCLALGNTVMLLQDVADFVAEGSEEFKDLMIMQSIQSLQRAVANSDCMKKYSSNLKKANQKSHAFEGELKQSRLDLASSELAGWLACMKELRTPSDHPAWNAVALLVELPEPPTVHSPIILSSFNEEEYLNQSAEEHGANVDVAQGNELGGGEGEGDVVVP